MTTATELPSCERFRLASGGSAVSWTIPLWRHWLRASQSWLSCRFESIQDADILAPLSAAYSPERNVVDSLRLIRADGPLKETLACFQMLAQLMKLPFRRDSIEKGAAGQSLRRG